MTEQELNEYESLAESLYYHSQERKVILALVAEVEQLQDAVIKLYREKQSLVVAGYELYEKMKEENDRFRKALEEIAKYDCGECSDYEIAREALRETPEP